MNPKQLLLSILTLITYSLAAQQSLLQYGIVNQADLQMTVYEKDSSAQAVVLIDFGRIDVEQNGSGFNYVFKHHQRIKLLDKNAFDEGDIAIHFYQKEYVYNIKAHTISPDGTTTEISKDNIYTEQINEYWKAKKFSFPNLTVGSIIEYTYEIKSEYITQLRDWYFQGEYPVRYSEVNINVHEKLEYAFLFQGKEKKEGMEGDGLVEINDNQFIMRHAAGLKEEAYITSMDNYRARLRFQLSRTYFPNQPVENILTTWEEVGKDLKHEYKFGQQYRFKRNFNKAWKTVEPLLKTATTKADKIKIIYEYVQQTVGWNGYYGIYADGTLDKIVREGTGDIASINILLIGLLREAGIKVHPMLCGSRNKGYPIENYSIMDQFNYVLAYVTEGEKPMLLDASSRYHPMGDIRTAALNYKGWVVEEGNYRWEAIEPQKSSEVLYTKLELDAEGNMTGLFKARVSGHGSIGERYQYFSTDGKYWEERLTKNIPDLKIDTIKYTNEDDLSKAFSTEINFTWEGASQAIGDFLYLSPFIYTNFGENPFKLEKRNYPVEIPYPIKEQMILNLVIPDGYEVEALPDNIAIAFPDKDASFRFLAETKNNMVTITSKIEINRLVFDPLDYDAIKGFFDSIIEAFKEQIVLKKG